LFLFFFLFFFFFLTPCLIPLPHFLSNPYSCELRHIFVLHMAHFPTQSYSVSTQEIPI
jgi:hypothetical protein